MVLSVCTSTANKHADQDDNRVNKNGDRKICKAFRCPYAVNEKSPSHQTVEPVEKNQYSYNLNPAEPCIHVDTLVIAFVDLVVALVQFILLDLIALLHLKIYYMSTFVKKINTTP